MCLPYFTNYKNFLYYLSHPFCSIFQPLIYFYGPGVFHSEYISYFIYPFIVWSSLSFFHHLSANSILWTLEYRFLYVTMMMINNIVHIKNIIKCNNTKCEPQVNYGFLITKIYYLTNCNKCTTHTLSVSNIC